MINIKKTIREIKVAPPTEEVKTYIDSKGQEHDTLFGAIKANHDIPLIKLDKNGAYHNTLYEYFKDNWDIQDNYEHQVSFTEFRYNEEKYYGFVCSSEDDAELAILLLGYYTGRDRAWEQIDLQSYSRLEGTYDRWIYDKRIIGSVYEHLLDHIKKEGCVGYYFAVDDRGDSPDFYHGLLSEIEKEMRDEVTNLQAELKKVSSLSTRAHTKGYSITQEKEGHSWAEFSFHWTPDKSADEIQKVAYEAARILNVAHEIEWDYEEIETGPMAGGVIASYPNTVYFYQDEKRDEIQMVPGDTIYCSHDMLELWRNGEVVQQWSPLHIF